MAANGLSIEMLPARHGDALWVEWGPVEERHRMLIDAGPRAAFDDVRQRIERLDAGQRRFDLLVVTHIDLDHIGGAIELLQDDSLGVQIDDVWFNDYHHLSDEPPTRGARQGEFLGDLLHECKLPWNKAFSGGPVRVEPNRPLPRVRLHGDLTVVLLSPTPDKLTALRGEWEKTIAEARKKEEERAAEESAGAATRGGRTVFGGDGSKANGSSIAMIVEYQDERWLLAGDAHADVLLAGVQQYGREAGEPRVRLDGFKLPHHGSTKNITPELLAAVDCRRYLISTNGDYFKHPDSACIDLIARDIDHPDLVFNYRSEFTAPWATQSDTYTSSFADASPVTALRHERAAAKMKTPSWAHSSAPDPAPPAPAAEVRPSSPSPQETWPPLAVKVVHGSLERASHPVMVGHYQATPLSGAEGFVDRRYGGRLLDRLASDQYPGRIGESLMVAAPRRKHPHQGVLVLGLGEYGELTPTTLVEAVRAALVHYALDQADQRDVPPLDLGISSVLLGATGGQGLSISSSVRAVVDGVCEANRDLRARDDRPRAQFATLELWERNAPEAELAFLSFEQGMPGVRGPGGRTGEDDNDAGPEFIAPTKLHTADGSLADSLPVDSHAAEWWRVRVCQHASASPDQGSGAPPAEIELEFTVGGRLARTGTVIHRVERRRLERILRDAVAHSKTDSGLHTTLFELLFPNELKWDLMAAQDIQLEVDDITADIPWEMLAARNPGHGTRGQLALRAGLIRQIRLPELRAVRRSTTPTALVIGNPPVGRLADSLPGAFEEAKAVSAALNVRGYTVTDLCYDNQSASDSKTSAIETALFADDYRIIHIAAHGFYQPDDPTRTGVAIGPDDFLTASMFRQLNVIPDVVFLNCCHLAAVAFGVEAGAIEFTQRNLNRLGASLARELIDCGVRAVVVAGWAVDDDAALAFANEFYREMLAGKSFGTAVHCARWAAWDAAPTHSTWGAYQCYGDGGYCLPQTGQGRRQASAPEAPRTLRGAVRALDMLVNRIKSVGIESSSDDDRTRTSGELTAIEAAARQSDDWLKNGHVCEALAGGWQAIGEFDKAIEWLEHALIADGRMTLAGVEQLANLRDRRAASLMRGRNPKAADRKRAAELTEQSLRAITLLEQLSGSGERHALRGGHFKRRAITLDGAERAAALEEAASAYLKAYRSGDTPWALLNYVQLEELRSRTTHTPSRVSEVAEDLDLLLASVGNRSYWDAVGVPDGQLTRAIIDDSIDASQAQLVERYADAFDNRSTWSQRSSTLDHLLDLAELHPDEQQAKAIRALHKKLEALT